MTHSTRYDGSPTDPLTLMVNVTCHAVEGFEASGTVPWQVDNYHDLVVVDCPFCEDETLILESDPETVRLFRRLQSELVTAELRACDPLGAAAALLVDAGDRADIIARANGCTTGEEADQWRWSLDRPAARLDGPTMGAPE